MKQFLAIAILVIAIPSMAQYSPPAVSSYVYSGSSWTAALSSGTVGPISYTPPAVALYCYNSGTGKWVAADASCFGSLSAVLPGWTVTGSDGSQVVTAPGTVAADSTVTKTSPAANVLAYGVAIGTTPDTGTDCAVGSNCAKMQAVLDTGLNVFIPWDGTGNHCVHIAGSLQLTHKGQIIEGATNQFGGICEDQPNVEAAIKGVSNNDTGQSIGVKNLLIGYVGPAASGATATATISSTSQPYVTGWPASTSYATVTGFTVTAGGTNYHATPGVGVNGCLNITTLAAYTGTAISTLTPAYLAPGSGATNVPPVTAASTGYCLWANPNIWTASMVVPAHYAIVDSNNNVEIAVNSGTAGSGAAPAFPQAQGSYTYDNGIYWLNARVSDNWAANTTFPQFHAVVVNIGGTYYIMWNQRPCVSGATEAAWSATYNSANADGTCSWLNQGIYGAVDIVGGSTGDPTGAALTGWGVKFTNATDSVYAYSGNQATLEHVSIRGFGSGVSWTSWGLKRANDVEVWSHDGNGYGYKVNGNSNNSDQMVGMAGEAAGTIAFIGQGAGDTWKFGDFGGNLAQNVHSLVSKGFELACQCDISLGNTESSSQFLYIDDNAAVNLGTSYWNPGRPAFTPFAFVGRSSLNLSLSSTATSNDWGIPLVQELSPFSITTGSGAISGELNNVVANNLQNKMNYYGDVIAISALPAFNALQYPTPNAQFNGQLWPVSGYQGAKGKLIYNYMSAGVPAQVDVLASPTTGNFTSSVAATAPLIAGNTSATAGALIATFSGPSGVTEYQFQTTGALFEQGLTFISPTAATSGANASSPKDTHTGYVYNGSASVVEKIIWSNYIGAGTAAPAMWNGECSSGNGCGMDISQFALGLKTPLVNIVSTVTTVSCSTSGTAIFTEPEQGSSQKEVSVFESNCVGTASYTYPAAFGHTPDIQGALASTASASTTAVTVTGVTSTGWVFLRGW